MLKKCALKKITISSVALFLFIIICLIPSNKPHNNINIIYEKNKNIPVYLKDNHNYISRLNVTVVNDDVNYIIDLLTVNGKNKGLIPLGFYPLIPENTKLLDYEIKNNILYLNFSEELLNVNEDNEERLIESLIYTLCELKDVKGIVIKVNNIKLDQLKKTKKKLPNILNYEYGINKSYNINSIKNSEQVTVYYLSEYNDINYYIPITKISNTEKSKVEVIVSELKTTPYINGNISSYLKASYELEQYEILENSIKLTFNNELLMGVSDKNIEEELKYMLTLSLRDTYNIEDITININ